MKQDRKKMTITEASKGYDERWNFSVLCQTPGEAISALKQSNSNNAGKSFRNAKYNYTLVTNWGKP